MKLYTGMNSCSDKNEFIIVYPDATDHRRQFLNKDILQNEIDYFFSSLEIEE